MILELTLNLLGVCVEGVWGPSPLMATSSLSSSSSWQTEGFRAPEAAARSAVRGGGGDGGEGEGVSEDVSGGVSEGGDLRSGCVGVGGGGEGVSVGGVGVEIAAPFVPRLLGYVGRRVRGVVERRDGESCSLKLEFAILSK